MVGLLVGQSRTHTHSLRHNRPPANPPPQKNTLLGPVVPSLPPHARTRIRILYERTYARTPPPSPMHGKLTRNVISSRTFCIPPRDNTTTTHTPTPGPCYPPSGHPSDCGRQTSPEERGKERGGSTVYCIHDHTISSSIRKTHSCHVLIHHTMSRHDLSISDIPSHCRLADASFPTNSSFLPRRFGWSREGRRCAMVARHP